MALAAKLGHRRRLARQELGGDLLDDNPSALWKHDSFVHHELDFDLQRRDETYEDFVRRELGIRDVVVAIDAAVMQAEDSSETGFVVIGRGAGGRFFLLEDATVGPGDVPIGALAETVWARRSVDAAWHWRAGRITAEVNNGGNLVAANRWAFFRAISTASGTQARAVPYQVVNARQGKAVRAEPAAMLY